MLGKARLNLVAWEVLMDGTLVATLVASMNADTLT